MSGYERIDTVHVASYFLASYNTMQWPDLNKHARSETKIFLSAEGPH